VCGRATYKLTWEEIVALYRLTLRPPPCHETPCVPNYWNCRQDWTTQG
jgi:hypothetical protein